MSSRKLSWLVMSGALLVGAGGAEAHHSEPTCRRGADVEVRPGDPARPVAVTRYGYFYFENCQPWTQVRVDVSTAEPAKSDKPQAKKPAKQRCKKAKRRGSRKCGKR